ncbi:MAG TPA: branched-chain amino acid ABC transporter permease [Armatimonadota bacterium]|nr:branched-chain amino acid ABC transporter permease [Armatimonadota bacterium]
MPSGSDSPARSPRWIARAALYLFCVAALFALDQFVMAPLLLPYVYATIIRIGIYAILAASLNLVNGVTGQFSLGHAAFMAIGAYVAGAMSVAASGLVQNHPGWEGSAIQAGVFLAGCVAAVIVASLAGLTVGLPTLRLRGDYLAIATLGFGEITRVIFQGWDHPFGGATGLSGVPTVTSFFWTYLFAGTAILLLRNLQWSGPGRDFMAVREDEIAAAAVGVDVVRAKVVAFIVAAGFAGIAGVLLVHQNNGIDPQQAGFLNSIEIVVMVVLGGMGSLTGSILGAALLVILRAVVEGAPALSDYARYENVIYPVLLIGLMLVRREGLLGYKELSWKTVTPLFTRWRKLEKL